MRLEYIGAKQMKWPISNLTEAISFIHMAFLYLATFQQVLGGLG
jgi:hypothetical protein